MLYIIVWFAVLSISILLFRKASGTLSFTMLNIHSFIFYYSLFISSFIGSLLIVLEIDHHYIINKLIFAESRVIGFWLVCMVMILLPLTMVMVSKLFGFQSHTEFHSYWKAPLVEVYTGKIEKNIFAALGIISILAVLYTLWKTFPSPLFQAIFGSGADLAKARIEAKGQITGIGNYFKNIFAIGLIPLLSLIAYCYAEMTHRLKWWIWFIVLFLFSILIQLYDLQKSPVLFYMAMFILLRMWIGKTKLNFIRIATLCLIAVVYLIGIYAVFGVGENDFFTYNKGPIGRIILTQVAPTYIHIDRYDEVYPYLREEGLPSAILQLYDEDPVRSSTRLMADLFPDKVAEGTAGVLNTLYVGELYASFGWFGVILGTVFLGIIIQSFYILVLRLPKHPILVSLLIFYTINIPRGLVGGFSDLIFNSTWITLTIIVLFPLLFATFKEYYYHLMAKK